MVRGYYKNIGTYSWLGDITKTLVHTHGLGILQKNWYILMVRGYYKNIGTYSWLGDITKSLVHTYG